METISSFLTTHPFAELALLLCFIIAISYIMKLLKQPLLIGYILGGILIGPVGLDMLNHTEQIETFSHIGIALLLFMVGLGLNPRHIKELGKASLVVGIGQVLFTTLIGACIALWLGFDLITSGYIAIALAFSSTIIIVKLLSDKGVLDEVYGKISIGMLIIQDIIAMIFLMILSSLPVGGAAVNRGIFSLTIFVKVLIIAAILYLLMKYVIPRAMTAIAKSQEFLLIFAIGWCMLWAAAMDMIGFSLEIGALLAGLSLAAVPYRVEIMSKIKPLRDFFIMLFFAYLGSQLQFSDLSAYLLPIAVFSVFVLVGNPFIVMVLMGYLGYKKKNSMMVGFTVAQISEFSFILIAIALAVGHITNPDIVSLVTIVGLITITGSSYYFQYADRIYAWLKPRLSIFERKDTFAERGMNHGNVQYDTVVFGNHRTGKSIIDMLIKRKKNFTIVDYDPQVIRALIEQNIPCTYGDASDIDTLEELNLTSTKMLISTIHDYYTNSLILQHLKKVNTNTVIIMNAHTLEDAEGLYSQGAHYVLVPHVMGGRHTAMLIEQYEYDIEKYVQQKVHDHGLL